MAKILYFKEILDMLIFFAAFWPFYSESKMKRAAL